MKFADLFGKATSARWIKYSEYDAMQAENGDWYIMPTRDAVPSVYDPIEKATDKQKAVFFPKVIEKLHPAKIA